MTETKQEATGIIGGYVGIVGLYRKEYGNYYDGVI